ncbi:hypothetical protein [Methanococcus maripaludis]|uniref:Uncharacterized protein YoxC n=1 Tax=Methanococcus maripaludis TaxID=39152 RepID=A0A8T4CKF3_METMI|nr:hypothetical protein [Methanococcus maripaludis]MBM7409001.1 uncharacterized protein YoxC [Methanococcus maripaludis]MBP2218813.1 uncharacterized protein YoxC [Methanococcus maripaludis]
MMQQLKLLVSLFAVLMILMVGMKTINDSKLLDTTDSFTETYFDYAESTLELSEKVMNNTESLSGNNSKEKAIETVSMSVDDFNESLNYVMNMEKYLNDSDESKDSEEEPLKNPEKTENSQETEPLESEDGIIIEVDLK